MNSLVTIVLYGIAIYLLLKFFNRWRRSRQNWLPVELRGSDVVFVERSFSINLPFPVSGRPDKVYRIGDGRHVPLEYKNRDNARVYETDIAQLSLQAWLLRLNGYPTTPFGFVTINSRKQGKRYSKKVELRDDRYCEQLVSRYLDIIEQRSKPRKVRSGKCNTCGHRTLCRP